MTILNKTAFGNYIAKCREAKKYTQRRLGGLLDVDPSTIGKIEIGERLPSFELFFDLCEVLGLDETFALSILAQKEIIRGSDFVELPATFTAQDRQEVELFIRFLAWEKRFRSARPQARQELRSEAYSDMDFLEKIDTIGEGDEKTDKNKPA